MADDYKPRHAAPEPQPEAAAPSLADEGIEPRMSDEKPRMMMACFPQDCSAYCSADCSADCPHRFEHLLRRDCSDACKPIESLKAELTNLRESHDRLKASYVANPEHWRSRCEMLETEVERLRKGAMQRAKEWMESAAEALAQENENARLRAELAAEKRRVERVRALADNWSTDVFGAYGEVDGRPLAAEIYAALADEAAK